LNETTQNALNVMHSTQTLTITIEHILLPTIKQKKQRDSGLFSGLCSPRQFLKAIHITAQ
jgi:hypothetical protein